MTQSIVKIGARLIALAWLWKAVTAALGLPRVPNLNLPEFDRTPAASPVLTVIVPACNEEAAVGDCLQSLLDQDYPNLHILAVDDRSTDRTPEILDGLAALRPDRLHVIHITTLPAGWLGKTHAMALAARHAESVYHPGWLLFTDADVLFRPDAIRRSLALATAQHADHFVTLPTPILRSRGEAMLLGFLPILGLWAVRPWKVADDRARRDAVGIGAFNLLRVGAYREVGGFDALRMEILEDLTLARKVKLYGLRQRIAFAPGMVRLHWAPGAFGVVNVMTKNLFAVFRFRAVFLLGACVWLLTVCVGPCLGLLYAPTRVPSAVALLSIAALYRLFSTGSGISPWNAIFFPVSAGLFAYSLLRSLYITKRQGGVQWRGTLYPLEELRKFAGPMIMRAPKRRALSLNSTDYAPTSTRP